MIEYRNSVHLDKEKRRFTPTYNEESDEYFSELLEQFSMTVKFIADSHTKENTRESIQQLKTILEKVEDINQSSSSVLITSKCTALLDSIRRVIYDLKMLY